MANVYANKNNQFYTTGSSAERQHCLNCQQPASHCDRCGDWRRVSESNRDISKSDRHSMLSEARMELYKKGLTDAQIARLMGVVDTTICSWRSKNKLPPNKQYSDGD